MSDGGRLRSRCRREAKRQCDGENEDSRHATCTLDRTRGPRLVRSSVHRQRRERPVARAARDRVCTSPLGDGRTHRAKSCSRDRERRSGSRNYGTGSTRLSVVCWISGSAFTPRIQASRPESSREVRLNPSGNCIWNVPRPSHHPHNQLPMRDLRKTGASHRTP